MPLRDEPGQLPGMASRRERRLLPVKQRLAVTEEFAAALLPLVLHLADQLETALGRPFLRDVFPQRERYETAPKPKP